MFHVEHRMATNFRRALLIWLWLCAAGIAAEINLRDAAYVDHAVVRLGDVAEIYGMDHQTRSKLLAIELLPSPKSGQAKKLRAREIQDAIAQRAPECVAWTIAGASEVSVRRRVATTPEPQQVVRPKSQSVSPAAGDRARNELEEAILAYIKERLGNDAWQVEVELNEQQLAILASAKSLHVTGGRYLDDERVQFRVEAETDAERATWTVDARVTLPPMMVVARRNLDRGELVAEEDVELVRAAASPGMLKPYQNLEDVVGKETTRAIPAGQPITEPSVRATLLVQRGQVVTVYSRCGGVQIRVTGRAKENGSLGELVPVEAINSRETFHARVSGPQEVEIFAASTTTPTVDDQPRAPTPWLAEHRRHAEAAARKAAQRTPGVLKE